MDNDNDRMVQFLEWLSEQVDFVTAATGAVDTDDEVLASAANVAVAARDVIDDTVPAQLRPNVASAVTEVLGVVSPLIEKESARQRELDRSVGERDTLRRVLAKIEELGLADD